MDTELSSAESIPALMRWSSDDLRRVRIALGEYARHGGLHDPIEVLAFTRLCIRGATERMIATRTNDFDALFHEALKIASESCGICKKRSSNAMSTPKKSKNISHKSDPVRKASSMISRASGPKIIAPVPEPHGRAMPPQPLGELPDVRPARLWNSLLQVAWRPVGTLLSSMFVRSE